MAGSLNHITAEDGSFTMDTIENMGDAHEALEECHQVIAWLLVLASGGDKADARNLLAEACNHANAPIPAMPAPVPEAGEQP